LVVWSPPFGKVREERGTHFCSCIGEVKNTGIRPDPKNGPPARPIIYSENVARIQLVHRATCALRQRSYPVPRTSRATALWAMLGPEDTSNRTPSRWPSTLQQLNVMRECASYIFLEGRARSERLNGPRCRHRSTPNSHRPSILERIRADDRPTNASTHYLVRAPGRH